MKNEKIIRMDEINPWTIAKDIIRNLFLLIMAAGIALMGVRIYKNIIYVPEYTTSATMAVMAKGDSGESIYSPLDKTHAMAEVFTDVFESEVMKEKMEEKIGKIPGEVKTTASLIPTTNLLKLTVTAKDPKTAYIYIQGILDHYQTVSDYLFENTVLEVIIEPKIPILPSNDLQIDRLYKWSVLSSVLLMLVLIVIASLGRRTVKTTRAGRKMIEGRCLAIIPYEEKNKTWKSKLKKIDKSILISDQVVSFQYEESFHKLALNIEYLMEQNGKCSVLVTSVEENEGKSTVCVNLATALAKRNKKVLVIDMDFKKPSLHKLLGKKQEKEDGILKLFKGEKCLDDLVRYDEKKNIYAIFNGQDRIDCQKELKPELLERTIYELTEAFDYVILDSAPVLACSDTEYLKDFVGCSLMVVKEDKAKFTNISKTIEMLKEGRSYYIGYVLNAFKLHCPVRKAQYSYAKYDTRTEE